MLGASVFLDADPLDALDLAEATDGSPPLSAPGGFPQYSCFLTILRAGTILPFTNFLRNTTIITVHNVLGNLVSCTLAGYAFARLRARGREFIFLAMLATMMLPEQTTIIPTFVLFKTFGWINTFYPLMVPGLVQCAILCVPAPPILSDAAS